MFDLEKLEQAAAWLLRRHGGRMDAGKLVKLVYLADREAMAAHYIPISGDDYLAMATGPACRRLSELARGAGEAQAQAEWDAAFGREGGDVVALKELPRGWLSDAEAGILDGVDARFGGMSAAELSEWTHNPANCPEWKEPEGEPVPIERDGVMRALGFDDVDMEVALEENAVYDAAQRGWGLVRKRG